MNRHAVRALLVVVALLSPFVFGGGARFGLVASASVMPTFNRPSDVAPGAAHKSSPSLTPQDIRFSNGVSGWYVRLPRDAGGNEGTLGSPAVANGHVLIGGGFDSTKVYAFDAQSGSTLWMVNTNDNGPTTPVINNNVGVYNTESCTVEAVDINTGSRLWSRTVGDPLVSQPAVADGRVYMAAPSMTFDGDTLYCMSLANGDTIWTQKIGGDPVSCPVVHEGAVYCATADGAITKINAASGHVDWKRDIRATSAPWIDENGTVTVSQRIATHSGPTREGFATTSVSGKGEHSGVAAGPAPYLDAGKGVAGNAGVDEDAADNLGLESTDGAWAYQGSRPIVIHGYDYCVQGNVAKCIDSVSGHVIWQRSFDKNPHMARTLTPLSEAGGKLYFGTSTGTVGCLSKSNGALIWTCKLHAPISCAPSVSGGCVYVTTTDGCLYCLNTHDPSADGWPMWGGGSAHDGPQG